VKEASLQKVHIVWSNDMTFWKIQLYRDSNKTRDSQGFAERGKLQIGEAQGIF